jgi:RNA polymerase sigma factor (sigma-70 family)
MKRRPLTVHEAQLPLELKAVFNKRGSDWTPNEKDDVVQWLYTHKLRYLLAFSLRHLGPYATREDAEDVWQRFMSKRWEGVVRNYDPARKGNDRREEGDCPFWIYLKRSLKNFSIDGRPRPPVVQHEPTSTGSETGDDQSGSGDIPDTSGGPEDKVEWEQICCRMEKCLQRLANVHARKYEVLVLSCFEERSHKEIAVTLCITETYSKQLLMRARLWLRECLEGEGIQL